MQSRALIPYNKREDLIIWRRHKTSQAWYSSSSKCSSAHLSSFGCVEDDDMKGSKMMKNKSFHPKIIMPG